MLTLIFLLLLLALFLSINRAMNRKRRKDHAPPPEKRPFEHQLWRDRTAGTQGGPEKDSEKDTEDGRFRGGGGDFGGGGASGGW